jgi:hypothetical protein
VRENVYDISALKPDGKTVSKEQTMYACPVEILEVPKWIENDMESKFVAKKTVKGGMFRKLVDGIWGWYGVLFERKVNGKLGWHEYGNKDYHAKYVGKIKNGEPNGQGKWTLPNGNKYEGEWKSGKKHGQGTLNWSNGDKYEGEWKDGIKHGQGILNWSNGNKYEGEWKSGKNMVKEHTPGLMVTSIQGNPWTE